MFTFKVKYLILAILLFVVEFLIALFIKDSFIRPFIGDTLVVILLYCFFRIFLKTSIINVAIGVLLFAYMVEVLQYFQFVDYLGLRNIKPLAVALGSTFDWMDILAYTIGFFAIILVERPKLSLH